LEVFSRSTFTEKNGRSDDAATRSTDGGGDGLNAVTRSTNVHAGGVTNMPSTVHASLMARCLYPPKLHHALSRFIQSGTVFLGPIWGGFDAATYSTYNYNSEGGYDAATCSTCVCGGGSMHGINPMIGGYMLHAIYTPLVEGAFEGDVR